MPTTSDRKVSPPLLVVLLLSAAYAAFSFRQAHLRLANFLYYDFDLAIANQICANLLRGSIDCSIRGGPFLGDHFRPIFFLILPAYALYPSPLLLLFLQSLALAGAAVPLYFIGRRLISAWWGAFFALLYLIYPATGYVNSFEFHPVALATFFLATACYGWVKERLWVYYLFSGLAILCREEMALVILFFGLYGLLKRRRWTWSVLPMAAGGAWFVLCVGVLIPYFKGGSFEYSALLSGFGSTPGSALAKMLTDPAGVARYLLQPPKPRTILQLLYPLLFLPLLSPLALLPALPIVLINFLSSYTMAWTLYFHYAAAVIPFVFLASILAAKRVLARFTGRFFGITLAAALLAAAVLSNWCIGPPVSALRGFFIQAERPRNAPLWRDIVDSLEGEEGIVATFRFLPALSSRRSVYPFHFAMWGTGKLTPERFVLPEDVEWAVVDFDDPLTFHSFFREGMGPNVRPFVEGGEWGAVELLGTVAVLKKGERGRYRLIEPAALPPENRVEARSADMAYLGYDAIKDTWRDVPVVSLRCYWEALEAPAEEWAVVVQLTDGSGRLLETLTTDLGYYGFPARSWKRGQRVSTFYRVPLLDPPSDGDVSVRVGLYERESGRMAVFSSDGAKTVWLPAGSIDLRKGTSE